MRQLSVSWSDAYRRGDTAWYHGNLADHTITVLPNGSVRSKRESIAAMGQRTAVIEQFELSPELITVSGNLALETGVERLRVRTSQGQLEDRGYRYTVAYIRTACRWTGVLNHATTITP